MIQKVTNTLNQFETDLVSILHDKYLDILISGSVCLNDFKPHYGDIDFVVILESDLLDHEIESIFKLHDKYRNRELENLEYQLEGTYYPKCVLENPDNMFTGCYIGTSRNGWKKIGKNCHNWFDFLQFNTSAFLKNNSRIDIYYPDKNELHENILKDFKTWSNNINNENVPGYVIVQWVARVLYYLEYGKIGSKTESCNFLYSNYEAYDFFKYCADIRYPHENTIQTSLLNERIQVKAAFDIIKNILTELGLLV